MVATRAAASTLRGVRPRAPVSRGAPQACQQPLGLALVDRRQSHDGVSEELRVDAAEADEHDGSEARDLPATDDQLSPVLARGHSLDREGTWGESLLHVVAGGPKLACVGDIRR